MQLTLNNMIKFFTSELSKEYNYFIIEVKIYDYLETELIINPISNLDKKIRYFRENYNEDLTLKANNNIKIVNFDLLKSVVLS